MEVLRAPVQCTGVLCIPHFSTRYYYWYRSAIFCLQFTPDNATQAVPRSSTGYSSATLNAHVSQYVVLRTTYLTLINPGFERRPRAVP